MIKKLFIIVCLFSFAFTLTSASVRKISLKEAKDMALQYNTNVKNAKLDVRIAKKKIWETTAIGLPQISAKIEYQDIPNIPTTLIPSKIFDPNAAEGEFSELKFGTQHNANLSFTVDQMIFNGSYIVGLQASKIYLKLSQDLLKKSEEDIKEVVTNTYYLILLAEETEKILDQSIVNIEKTLFETSELYKSGFLEETDVDQIKLSITDLKNSLSSIKRQKNISYRLFKFQIGIDLDEKIMLSENLNLILKNVNYKKLLSKEFNVANYIDFIMLNTEEVSKKLLLKNEKAAFLPKVSAFFLQKSSAMRDEFNFFKKTNDKWFSSTIIGLNIDIPIFDSGMKLARIGQAKLELRKVQNSKKYAKKGLKVEWERSRSAFIDELNKLKNTKESVSLAQRIFDKNKQKYKQGTVSSMDLIQAHNQYLKSQSNYIQNIISMLNAKTKIDKYLNKL